MTLIQSKGRLLDLTQPVVMGILNATPDSFYSKQGDDISAILHVAEKMLKDGATILDIGGASTRPGQDMVSEEEELRRVIPAVTAIRDRFSDAWLSIDTYNAGVAKCAVEAGADIVNDVSSGRFDKNMLKEVAALKVPYIVMHMQGAPKNMQLDPQYNDVVAEVREFLRLACDQSREAGITDIIVDPGFGFGKSVEHNFALLRSMHTFRLLGKPILVGLSRKSMICKALKVSPEHALNGTTALNMAALQQGASILRVHDVKEAVEVVKLGNWLNS